ncbi:MAG: carbon starvation CstA family protein, partial [Deltaproteobacteria bacterium]|nr:carbon starvation CstA family protein [Deltaproteobacteria bacterium]
MKKASLVNRFLLGSARVTLPLFAGVSIVSLFLGYTLYGRFVARQYALNDATPTPAHLQNDGVDFVPTKKFYL